MLRRAVAFCDAGTAGVVSHADRGSRYTLTWLADVAEGLAVLLSAGRTGVCWDNARHESFWPTPKTEFHDRHEFATHAQAIQAVNSCTETVYNHRRPHDTLGQTPSNPRTPNHHRSQPDRSTDAHQTGPTPPGLAQLVALDVSQSGRPGRRLPLAVNDCSHRLGTDGVDRRTEHESEGLDMAYEQLPIVDVDLDGLLLDLENY